MKKKILIGLLIISISIFGILYLINSTDEILEITSKLLPDIGKRIFKVVSEIQNPLIRENKSNYLTLTPEDDFSWRIEKYEGDEKVLFNPVIENPKERITQVCLTPKFNGTIIREEEVPKEIILVEGKDVKLTETKNVTYTQPSEVKLVLRNGTSTQLIKEVDGSFCQILDISESDYWKFGNETIIIVGDLSYDSQNVNVTNEGNFAHLTIANLSTTYDITNAYKGKAIRSYWSFDIKEFQAFNGLNFTIDYSDSNLNGNLQQGVTFNTSGVYGSSYNFDGLSSITFGDVIDQTGSDPFSISLWVNSPSSGIATSLIGKRKSISPFDGYEILQLTEGTIRFYIGNNFLGNRIIIDSSTDLQNAGWTNVLVTYDGTKSLSGTQVYINGLNESIATSDTMTGNINTNAEFTIGGRDGVQAFFTGQIDEAMMWNIELNASEVLRLFNNQTERFVRTGTQRFRQFNITQRDDNSVNVTETFQNLLTTNISARIGQKNVSFNLTDIVMYVNYDFGTLNDWTTNRKTISGGQATATIDGVNGTIAVSYNGRDGDKLIYPDDDDLKLSGTMTISVWIKEVGNNEGVFFIGNIINKQDFTSSGYTIRCVVSGCDFSYGSSTGGATTSVTAINKDQWYHFVGVLNDSSASLYIDGTLNKTTAKNGAYVPNTDDLWIGSDNDFPERTFNGTIDEIIFWNRTLSDGEINALYNDTAKQFNKPQYTPYQNLTSGVNSTFIISNISGFVWLEDLYSSNDNDFYTPNLFGNITLDLFFSDFPINSCTPPLSGNWEVTCSDNCSVNGDIDLTGNLSINGGHGSFTINANITFTNPGSYIFQEGPMCERRINPGGSING